MPNKNIIKKSLKWSLISELALRGIAPVTLLVMTSLLAADDFGLIAIATAIVTLGFVISEAGLTKVLIQRKVATKRVVAAIYQINIVLALLVYICVLISIPVIKKIYGIDEIGLVLPIMALQIPISALNYIKISLLQKEFEYKKLFNSKVYPSIASSVAMVTAGLLGLGYWALVVGPLTFQIFQTLVLMNNRSLSPLCRLNKKLFVALIERGKWNLGNILVVWGYQWGVVSVIGIYSDTYTVGLYRVGSQIANLFYDVFFNAALPVLYSQYCKVQKNACELKKTIILATKASALFVCPVILISVMYSKELGTYLFHGKWPGIDTVIICIVIAEGISWLVGPLPNAFRSVGRADVDTKLRGLLFPVFYSLCVLGLISGINQMLFANILFCIVYVVIYSIIATNYFDLLKFYILKCVLRPAGLTVIAASLVLGMNLDPSIKLVVLASYFFVYYYSLRVGEFIKFGKNL